MEEICELYMQRTLELAKGGWGRTNPNPLVGAVIVKEGRIIGEGFHKALGCAHAEVEALNHAEEDVEGATLYVSLEPCSHFGRTPPCVQAVIASGIRRVVVAMTDPNPKVSGKGLEMLRDAGIEVVQGVLEAQAFKLNEIFVTYITKQKPFVIMKSAMTLDGKIASFSGDSKWISGEASRRRVHELRDRVAGVMVGIHTVLRDDPQLTTRLEGRAGKNPVRIVVDSKGSLPENSKILEPGSGGPVILATTDSMNEEKEYRLTQRGVVMVKCMDSKGSVDLKRLMEELFKREIDSILLEGGGSLNASALSAGIVDKVMFFIAPKILGGQKALTPVEGQGVEQVSDALKLREISVEKVGEDILVEGYLLD